MLQLRSWRARLMTLFKSWLCWKSSKLYRQVFFLQKLFHKHHTNRFFYVNGHNRGNVVPQQLNNPLKCISQQYVCKIKKSRWSGRLYFTFQHHQFNSFPVMESQKQTPEPHWLSPNSLLSLPARHQDPRQVFSGWPSEEDFPHSQWWLHRQRRQSGHSSDRRREWPALQLRAPEHRPRGAHLAGHQWLGDRRPVGGPVGLQPALQELGDGDHPAARRRARPELRHLLHHGQREVVWWELPSRKGFSVRVQHRLKVAFSDISVTLCR